MNIPPILVTIEPGNQFSVRCWMGFHRYITAHRPRATGGVCERCGAAYWIRIPEPPQTKGLKP